MATDIKTDVVTFDGRSWMQSSCDREKKNIKEISRDHTLESKLPILLQNVRGWNIFTDNVIRIFSIQCVYGFLKRIIAVDKCFLLIGWILKHNI